MTDIVSELSQTPASSVYSHLQPSIYMLPQFGDAPNPQGNFSSSADPLSSPRPVSAPHAQSNPAPAPLIPSTSLEQQPFQMQNIAPSASTPVKHRRRTNSVQLKALEAQYEVNCKPDPARRSSLAQELGMSPREVQVWFQNRRAKIRKAERKRMAEFQGVSTGLGRPGSSAGPLNFDHTLSRPSTQPSSSGNDSFPISSSGDGMDHNSVNNWGPFAFPPGDRRGSLPVGLHGPPASVQGSPLGTSSTLHLRSSELGHPYPLSHRRVQPQHQDPPESNYPAFRRRATMPHIPTVSQAATMPEYPQHNDISEAMPIPQYMDHSAGGLGMLNYPPVAPEGPSPQQHRGSNASSPINSYTFPNEPQLVPVGHLPAVVPETLEGKTTYANVSPTFDIYNRERNLSATASSSSPAPSTPWNPSMRTLSSPSHSRSSSYVPNTLDDPTTKVDNNGNFPLQSPWAPQEKQVMPEVQVPGTLGHHPSMQLPENFNADIRRSSCPAEFIASFEGLNAPNVAGNSKAVSPPPLIQQAQMTGKHNFQGIVPEDSNHQETILPGIFAPGTDRPSTTPQSKFVAAASNESPPQQSYPEMHCCTNTFTPSAAAVAGAHEALAWSSNPETAREQVLSINSNNFNMPMDTQMHLPHGSEHQSNSNMVLSNFPERPQTSHVEDNNKRENH